MSLPFQLLSQAHASPPTSDMLTSGHSTILLVDPRLFLGPGVNGRAEASAILGFLNALLAAMSIVIALAARRFSSYAGKG